MHVASLEALLSNSVTFDVPAGMPRGESIEERHFYKIYSSYEHAIAARYNSEIEYVVLVSESIRGLNVGAPVEYRGLRIGEVVDTNIFVRQDSSVLNEDIKIPVLVKFQPGLANLPDDASGNELMRQQIDHWIKNGLRARLQTGNLLTGSLFVELQHYDNKLDKLARYADYTVIPTEDNALSQIAAKASSFMDKLNAMPLESLSKDSSKLIAELTSTVKALRTTSNGLTALFSDAQTNQLPAKLASALDNFARVTNDYAKGSSNYQELEASLKALTTAFNEIQPLLQELQNKPDSLIFSGAKEETLQPRKYQGPINDNE